MFFRLLKTDFKRIGKLLPPLFLTTILLSAALLACAAFADQIMYKEKRIEPICVGIVMSIDSSYGDLAYQFVTEMDSYSTACSFVKLSSEESGAELLKSGEIQAMIIVPDQILADIMDGTNTPVTVVYNEDGSLETYLLNEIFVSTSSLLGTSQAAIYTALNLSRSFNFSPDLKTKVSADTNALFLNYVLRRTDIFDETSVRATGIYSIQEFYTASGILLLLSLSGILFMSFLKSNSSAYRMKLKISGITGLHTALSQWISITCTLYGLYLLLYILLVFLAFILPGSLLTFTFAALPVGIPVSLLIALLTVCISKLPANQAGASLILFVIIFILAFTGGCLVPRNLLPDFLKPLCSYTPYYYLLQLLCEGFF